MNSPTTKPHQTLKGCAAALITAAALLVHAPSQGASSPAYDTAKGGFSAQYTCVEPTAKEPRTICFTITHAAILIDGKNKPGIVLEYACSDTGDELIGIRFRGRTKIAKTDQNMVLAAMRNLSTTLRQRRSAFTEQFAASSPRPVG